MDKQQESVAEQPEIKEEEEKQEPSETKVEQIQPSQPQKEDVIQRQSTELPVQMKNRKSIYVSDFDWGLNSFNEEAALKHFSMLGNTSLAIGHQENNNISLMIVDSTTKVSGLTKYTNYIIRGEDPKRQKIQILRKSSDFVALREALVRRWPGFIIPPISEKLSVGVSEGQILKNKVRFLNNFLNRLCKNEAIYYGEQMEVFLKGQESTIEKQLQKLKSLKPSQLLKIYNEQFPYVFEDKSEKFFEESQEKIDKFQNYFRQKKTDLNYLKDQAKRTSEYRDKLIKEQYKVLNKLLPSYEETCLNWFHLTKPHSEIKSEQEQNTEEDKGNTIYASQKYQSILEAYREELFIEDGRNPLWQIFQIFKFELKEIDTALQAITQYKLLSTEKKFYARNVENNKKQIEDINNNKTSLKIFFLSGSTDEKKTQLANETQFFETEYKIREQLWMGVTQLMVLQIRQFFEERAHYYKHNLKKSLKMEAVYMGKLFNLYVEAQRL